MEVIAEDSVEVHYLNSTTGPPLWSPTPLETQERGGDIGRRSGGVGSGGAGGAGGEGGDALTVIWTCPDWEVDWISEILRDAGIDFRIVYIYMYMYLPEILRHNTMRP